MVIMWTWIPVHRLFEIAECTSCGMETLPDILCPCTSHTYLPWPRDKKYTKITSELHVNMHTNNYRWKLSYIYLRSYSQYTYIHTYTYIHDAFYRCRTLDEGLTTDISAHQWVGYPISWTLLRTLSPSGGAHDPPKTCSWYYYRSKMSYWCTNTSDISWDTIVTNEASHKLLSSWLWLRQQVGREMSSAGL